MIGHSLIDEVTGYLNDVNTLMMDLDREKNCFVAPGLNTSEVKHQNQKNGTIAVSSSAMSRVPVTRRKMIKMLMILSSDRSNHTIICTEKRGGRTGGKTDDTEEKRGKSKRGGRIDTKSVLFCKC